MKRIMTAVLFACAMGMAAVASATAKELLPDWQNPGIVEHNRVPMSSAFETDGIKMTLNGTWDFCWYETIDSRSMDFYKTDFDASGWDTMPVPGLWEMNGYGDPVYKNVGYAWVLLLLLPYMDTSILYLSTKNFKILLYSREHAAWA